MKKKFIQSEETRYYNNEYDNMPSIDYRFSEKQEELHTLNKDSVDWDIVKEICDKHGFEFTTIQNTFGLHSVDEKSAFPVEFVVHKKIDIDYETYEDWHCGNDNADKIWQLDNSCNDLKIKLHDCVHELDENTRLCFRTGWAGNCGLFGSDEVSRQSYLFGGHLTSWKFITDNWDPVIHDTGEKLQYGVYLMITTRYLKKVC